MLKTRDLTRETFVVQSMYPGIHTVCTGRISITNTDILKSTTMTMIIERKKSLTEGIRKGTASMAMTRAILIMVMNAHNM